MTIVLAIDCAAGACSAALCRVRNDGDDVAALAVAKLPMDRGHAEILMPLLSRLRDTAEVDWSEIGLIVATVGPGSFTGVRIGLSAARGIALATGAPTVAVQSLEAIAAGVRVGEPSAPLLVALDSRRGDAYGQWHLGGTALPPAVIPINRVEIPWVGGPDDASHGADILVAGDLADRLADHLRATGHPATAVAGTEAPDPVVLATLGYRRHAGSGPSPLRPIYLRPADAKPASSRPTGPK